MNQLAKKKIIKLSGLLLVSLTLASCGQKINKETAVASVDGSIVSKENYSNELEFYQDFYSKKYGNSFFDKESKSGKSNKEVLEDKLLDSMIKDQVMLNDLEKNKYEIDDNAANKLKTDMEKSIGDENSLKANVKALNVSYADFSDVLFNDSIRKTHYEFFLSHNDIKDSTILEDFKENKKLHRMYKYNVLVFDDENLAKRAREEIKGSKDFRSKLKEPIRNFSIYNSDFVYEDDPLLKESKSKEVDKVSDLFEYDGNYMILMVNSYNDNENDLLLKAKEVYLEKAYEKYLNKLVKSSKIKLFI